MEFFFGQASLRGEISRYLGQGFNLLELLARPSLLPKLKKLPSFHSQAPDDFVFSVVMDPDAFGDASSKVTQRAVEYSLRVAEALKARFLVMRPPSSFRPSASAERRLASMTDELRTAGHRVAWEATGLWQPSLARPLARRLDLTRVQRTELLEPEPTTYLRLMQLGVERSRLVHSLDAIAAKLADCDQVYVVLEGPGGTRIHREMRSAFSDLGVLDADESDTDDDDLEVDEEDGTT
jgi:hypothetical protein